MNNMRLIRTLKSASRIRCKYWSTCGRDLDQGGKVQPGRKLDLHGVGGGVDDQIENSFHLKVQVGKTGRGGVQDIARVVGENLVQQPQLDLTGNTVGVDLQEPVGGKL